MYKLPHHFTPRSAHTGPIEPSWLSVELKAKTNVAKAIGVTLATVNGQESDACDQNPMPNKAIVQTTPITNVVAAFISTPIHFAKLFNAK